MQALKIESLGSSKVSGGMGLVVVIWVIASLAILGSLILLLGGLAGPEPSGLGFGGVVAGFAGLISAIFMLAIADMVASLRVIRQVALQSIVPRETLKIGRAHV